MVTGDKKGLRGLYISLPMKYHPYVLQSRFLKLGNK